MVEVIWCLHLEGVDEGNKVYCQRCGKLLGVFFDDQPGPRKGAGE